MEREQQHDPLKQRMIEILEQNHWSVRCITRTEKDQRVLHEYLVEGKSLREIAERLGLSREWVRYLKDRAMLFLERHIEKLKNATQAADGAVNGYVPLLDFDYDVLLVMQQPDEKRVDEVKQLLSTPIEDMDFSVRTFNALKFQKLNYLRDIVEFDSPADLFKFRNVGRKGVDEIETLVYSMGLKWIRSPAFAKYPGQAVSRITLPVTYPILNFTWSAEIQQVFKELNIVNLANLQMSRTLLLEKNLSPEHFNFIEQRLNEWGLKWK